VYNDIGIKVLNNNSLLKKNIIESSHSEGILILSENLQKCEPKIIENIITQSKYNGILI